MTLIPIEMDLCLLYIENIALSAEIGGRRFTLLDFRIYWTRNDTRITNAFRSPNFIVQIVYMSWLACIFLCHRSSSKCRCRRTVPTATTTSTTTTITSKRRKKLNEIIFFSSIFMTQFCPTKNRMPMAQRLCCFAVIFSTHTHTTTTISLAFRRAPDKAHRKFSFIIKAFT